MQSEQQQRIMGYFIEEAKDHLKMIEKGLLNLQGTIGDPELISEVFRAAHSVKGGAAMLGLDSIQHTSHRLEDYFKVLKECPITVDQKLETLFLRVFDTLQDLLEQLQGPFGLTQEKASEIMQDVEPFFGQLHNHLNRLVEAAGGSPLEAPHPVAVAYPPFNPTVSHTSGQKPGNSALKIFFHTTVTDQLRSLLSIFKKADTPNSRQQLQDVCQSLHSEGASVSASPRWQELVATAQRAIAHEENTYRQLAPVVIKALKQAQNLGIGNRDNDITVNAALLELLPPKLSKDITQDDDLMDALLADASRDADKVLDTVLDDALALKSDITEDIGDPDLLALGIDDELGGNGADPLASDTEIADLLDIDDVDSLSESPSENPTDEGNAADELATDNWLQDSFADSSTEEGAGHDWLSDVSTSDTPLEASLGLIDELDSQEPISSIDLTGVDALVEGLDDISEDGDDPIGPQVGPDEMDSLADLFSGDSDELNLDWDDRVGDDDSSDVLSDDLELEATSDFSDLLFDAGSNDNDIPQDLTADEDDISTLLNTLEMDGEAQDETELATTPLLRDVSMDDDSLDELLSYGGSEDEYQANEASNSLALDQSTSPNSTDELEDVWSEVGESGDGLLDAIDEIDESTVSDAEDTNFTETESSGMENLGAFLDGQQDDILGMEELDSSNASRSALSSEEFDQLFVGLDAEDSMFENQEIEESQPGVADNTVNPVSEGLSTVVRVEDDHSLADDVSSTNTVEDDVLGDLWTDETGGGLGEDPFQPESSVEAEDIAGDVWGLDHPSEESSDSESADLSSAESDVLDSLFGAPAPVESDVEPWLDNVDAEEMGAPESDDEALNSAQNRVDSLGQDEEEAPFLSDDISQDDLSEMTADALLDEAMLDVQSSTSEDDDSEIVSDIGFDLDDLGASEIEDSSGATEDLESSELPITEDDSLDDVLGDLFDQDIGGEPIIMDHDLSVTGVPEDEESVDLEAMFLRDVADDASISLSLESNSSLDMDVAERDRHTRDADITDLDAGDAEADLEDIFDDLEQNNFAPEGFLEGDASHPDSILDRDSEEGGGDEPDWGSIEATDDPVIITEGDDFAGLDALLEEDSDNQSPHQGDTADQESTVENDRVDLNIDKTEGDDFADLDALLSDAPAVADELEGTERHDDPNEDLDDDFADLEKLLEEADQSLGGPSSPSSEARQAAPQRRPTRRGFSNQTMRVSVKNLDNLNNLVGELVVNRNSLEQSQERLRQFLDNLLYQVQQLSDVGQRMRDLYERSLLESSLLSSRRLYQSASPSASMASDTAHATGARFDALEMDRFTGFHTLSQEMIELIVRVRESASDIDFVVDESDQVTRMFRQVTTQLQEGLTRTRMVPFAQAADRLPRAIRDISIKCGKQAKLVVEGRDTLIDKMILEQLYDPMTHLVNNAITHGIESPGERVEKNKNPVGTITIRSFHQGNQTIISVTDDGGGIDPEVVSRKAIEKGLITAQEAEEMSRLDLYDLLFHHGFSTRDKADDFAGRGVGMDVVRTSLGEIRGVVNIDSTIDQGTTFTIRLPLTLSISKALLCVSNRARIAFPMDGVEDMLDVPQDRIQSDDQGRPSIMWRDILLPFRPLSDLLRFHRSLGRGSVYGGGPEDDVISVVVLRSGGNYLALQVDQVLGEQEIVIKQLEAPIPKPAGIAGATVLGDGRIMPIADVLELIDLSMGRIRRDAGSQLWEQSADTSISDATVTASEPTVLIVDDSITVRELLSMTFNKVGYRVEQARDGQEAWEKLRSGLPCDLVFCDIEMPRMDGLELLSRLQKDSNFNALPIAMLTSRGADRHRQMAVQLGAKGYFTKPYLEEALLDAAQRMLKGEVLASSEP